MHKNFSINLEQIEIKMKKTIIQLYNKKNRRRQAQIFDAGLIKSRGLSLIKIMASSMSSNLLNL